MSRYQHMIIKNYSTNHNLQLLLGSCRVLIEHLIATMIFVLSAKHQNLGTKDSHNVGHNKRISLK